MRLDGRLREVRGNDLAFERDEVEEVLCIQGVQLDPADLTTLWQRTEGWPAAVRLASLSLAQESDPAGFVAQFAGDDSAVADYLVSEILGRQSEGRQQFLLHTCVVAELTVELAAALSGRSDAGALLDHMAQANALVQRLGRSGEWFRYHTLLRSHLLAELHRRDLTATCALHRNAALWFDEADMAALAVEHAVAARDDALIKSMLARHGIRLMLIGRGPLVAQAIEESPPAVRDAPDILLLRSIVAFDADDRATGDHSFKRAQAQSEPVDACGRRLLEVARLYHARVHGDTGVLLDVGTEPGREPWDEDAELLMLTNRGWLRHVAGDYRGAKTDLCAALELSRRHGLDHLTLDCMNLLAGVAVALSDIRESSEWTRQTADLAAEHGWASSPRLAYAHMLASWCAHLMLDMGEASRHSAKSMAVLGGGATAPDVECAARTAAAIIAFDRYPRRRAALRDLSAIWHHELDFVPSPALKAYALAAEMRMSLTLGERGHAATVVDRAEELLPGSADATVIRALDLLDRHRHERARALVAPVLTGDLTNVVVPSHITAWLVDSLARAHAGMVESAHRSLLTALELGECSGAMRPFYDFGTPVRQLLVAALGRTGHLEAFLVQLLSAWRSAEAWQEATAVPAESSAERGRSGPTVLTAPLTVREIEVLRDLPSLLTAEEIAERHQVSVNTVKTHMRSLYRKLGAANRRDAVASARWLSLL